ncbi:MAG: ribbon-helix-helix protein, CopG family [Deltaproteobacteria bacterium]|nr:MAG: ribbon-helix-helix protein, CopG family [Deltaproteobacteria bacterium]
MRRKVGTALDERLIAQVKMLAAREGRPLNDVIEEALRRYLASRQEGDGSVVRETAATYTVTPQQLKHVLEEDFLESE